MKVTNLGVLDHAHVCAVSVEMLVLLRLPPDVPTAVSEMLLYNTKEWILVSHFVARKDSFASINHWSGFYWHTDSQVHHHIGICVDRCACFKDKGKCHCR